MERSKEFYKDILGLRIKYESPEWVEFLKDGAVLALHKSKIKVTNDRAMLNFITSDINDVRSILKSKGVRFYKDIEEDANGKYMIIEDPDGYKILIIEPKVKETMQATGYYGFAPI
jgi:catechol 2,3-dioxygenase-like lactoylglutathione lyase family enzyme